MANSTQSNSCRGEIIMLKFQKSTHWGILTGIIIFVASIIIMTVVTPPLPEGEESAMAWFGLFILIGASYLVGRAINQIQGLHSPVIRHYGTPYTNKAAAWITTALVFCSLTAPSG